jgi:hypothetical protein
MSLPASLIAPNMHQKFLLSVGSIVAAMMLAAVPAYSQILPANIAWGTPQGITGDSDVSTVGSFVYAYNFGMTGVTSETVNAVTFAAFAITGDPTTVGHVTVYDAGGDNNVGSASTPFSNLSSSYKGLLSSLGEATGAITMEFLGLTNGRTYQIQWWSNISSSASLAAQSHTKAVGSTEVTLNPNTDNATGGVGQFVLGTFTADASGGVSLRFENVNQFSVINAFQIRDVTAVPEPSTCALLGIGAVFGAWRLRRNRRS